MLNIDPRWDRANDPTPIEPLGHQLHKTVSTNGLAKRLDREKMFAGYEHRFPEVIGCFWPKVISDGPHGCWLWTGQVAKKSGYGRMRFELGGEPVVLFAHRFAFAITCLSGVVPEGVLVRHHCGERLCVNPNHLYLGDYRARPYLANGHGLGDFGIRLP